MADQIYNSIKIIGSIWKNRGIGLRIHHREAPKAVAAGQTDVAILYYHLALRYRRIFPDQYDTIPRGGTKADSEPPPGNSTYGIFQKRS